MGVSWQAIASTLAPTTPAGDAMGEIAVI